MSIPDCTLITACFCMHKYHNDARDINDLIKQTSILTTIPCYIVFYGDNITIPLLKNMRKNFLHLSEFYECEPEQLWSFQYLQKVKENREKYWPTRDKRTCSETHLLTCNKFDFILQTINKNPFTTTKFAWIDSFIKQDGTKICENYVHSKLLYVLDNITNKFHITIMGIVDKKFKDPKNKKEYYSMYRWLTCGSFFTCGNNDKNIKILKRLNEIFIETTNLGFGHGEEMFYLEVLDEFYDDIIRAYGDYGQIINNFIEPTRNINYIYNNILQRYRDIGYHREAIDCANTLIKQFDSHKIKMDYNLYLHILFSVFISSYYYNPELAKETCNKIKNLYKINPYIKIEYNKNKEFYDNQLDYVKYLN